MSDGRWRWCFQPRVVSVARCLFVMGLALLGVFANPQAAGSTERTWYVHRTDYTNWVNGVPERCSCYGVSPSSPIVGGVVQTTVITQGNYAYASSERDRLAATDPKVCPLCAASGGGTGSGSAGGRCPDLTALLLAGVQLGGLDYGAASDMPPSLLNRTAALAREAVADSRCLPTAGIDEVAAAMRRVSSSRTLWSNTRALSQGMADAARRRCSCPISDPRQADPVGVFLVGLQIGGLNFGVAADMPPDFLLRTLGLARDAAVASRCVSTRTIDRLTASMRAASRSLPLRPQVEAYVRDLATEVQQRCRCAACGGIQPDPGRPGFYVVRYSGVGWRKRYSGIATRIEGWQTFVIQLDERATETRLHGAYFRVPMSVGIEGQFARWRKEADGASLTRCKAEPPLCPCRPEPDIWERGPKYELVGGPYRTESEARAHAGDPHIANGKAGSNKQWRHQDLRYPQLEAVCHRLGSGR